MKEESKFDHESGRMIVKTSYDAQPVLDLNKYERNSRPEFGKYKGNLVQVGRLDEGDIVRLMNMGYNLYSPDPDEVRRTLLYIQTNEPNLLTVSGKPFAKQRTKWQ